MSNENDTINYDDREDYAFEQQRQHYIDAMTDEEFIESLQINRLTNGKGLPDGDDYELRKLEELK